MRDFDASEDDARTPEILEAHHRLDDAFDGAAILLDDVIQVFVLPDPDRCRPPGVKRFERSRLAPLLSTAIVSASPF